MHLHCRRMTPKDRGLSRIGSHGPFTAFTGSWHSPNKVKDKSEPSKQIHRNDAFRLIVYIKHHDVGGWAWGQVIGTVRN